MRSYSWINIFKPSKKNSPQCSANVETDVAENLAGKAGMAENAENAAGNVGNQENVMVAENVAGKAAENVAGKAGNAYKITEITIEIAIINVSIDHK